MNDRKRFRILQAAAAFVALTAGTATAQDRALPSPGVTDLRAEQRSATGPRSNASPKAVLSTVCGPATLNIIRAQNTANTTRSTSFTTVPGTSVSFNVGGPRCVKVVFTSETSCSQTSASDICYVRVLLDGIPMLPEDSFRAIDAEHSSVAGHAYEWIDAVDTGTHTVALQWRVASSATTFTIDDWTLDVTALE